MPTLFALLALIPALLFAQAPEFMQQYRQRIGGAADELAIVVRNFDEDSRRSGYDRQAALAVMGRNTERLVREQGQRMHFYIVRLDRLNRQHAALVGGVTVAGVVAVAQDYDETILRQTWNAFEPAFPTTMTGFVFAITGWALAFLLLVLLALAFRRRAHATA
jgi:hypothetical protein